MKALTDSILKDAKQYIASTKRAVTTALTAGQQGAALAARLIVELGASYDEAVATLKGQLKEAGLAPNLVNRSRELIPFAVATHGHDARDWPSVEFARAVLKRGGVTVTEAIDDEDWFELVATARQQAKLELERAAAERGDDDYSPDTEAVTRRVRSMPREETSTAATAATERTPAEHVMGVLELHWSALTADERKAVWNFRKA